MIERAWKNVKRSRRLSAAPPGVSARKIGTPALAGTSDGRARAFDASLPAMVIEDPTPSRRGPGSWLPWALTAGFWLVAAVGGALAAPESPEPVETPPPMRPVLDELLTTRGAAAFAEKYLGAASDEVGTSAAPPSAPPTPTEAPPPAAAPPVDAGTQPGAPRDDVRPAVAPTSRSPEESFDAAARAASARPESVRTAVTDTNGGEARTALPPEPSKDAQETVEAPAPPEPGTPTLSDAMAAANAHLNASRWTEAETAFTAALTLPGGRSATVLYGRARARERLGRTADAVSDLDAALALDPRHPYALLLYGDIAKRTRDTTTAATRYRAYLEAWPKGRRALEIQRWLTAHGE
jgi:tetratricopeptide (TPR) repeat protein